jgi:hypothetical protein
LIRSPRPPSSFLLSICPTSLPHSHHVQWAGAGSAAGLLRLARDSGRHEEAQQ